MDLTLEAKGLIGKRSPENTKTSASLMRSRSAGAYWSLQMQISGLVSGNVVAALAPFVAGVPDFSGALTMAVSTSSALRLPSMPSISSKITQFGRACACSVAFCVAL